MVVAIISSFFIIFHINRGFIIVQTFMARVTTIPHVILFPVFKLLPLCNRLFWFSTPIVATLHTWAMSFIICRCRGCIASSTLPLPRTWMLSKVPHLLGNGTTLANARDGGIVGIQIDVRQHKMHICGSISSLCGTMFHPIG